VSDDPIAFGKVKLGLFDGEPEALRWSTFRRRLHDQGADDTIAKIEADRLVAGSTCPTHGSLEDPIMGILDGRVAFVCPWCSGPEIQAAYEAEGKRGVS
jgi:hypothetical protein